MGIFVVLAALFYAISTAFLDSESGGRITIADIIIIVLIVSVMVGAVRKNKIFIGDVHISAIPLIFIFIFSSVFSQYPDRAIVELLAILLGFLGSLALINLFIALPPKYLTRFFTWYVILNGVLAFICILDFLFLPGLISSRNLGGLQGPFRNTGQAGSFFGVQAAICIPLVINGLVDRKKIGFCAIFLISLALIFTLKRAAILGFILGFLGLLIQNFFIAFKEKKGALGFIVFSTLACLGVSVLFFWALDNVDSMSWRLESKFSDESISDFQDGFLQQNILSTFNALGDMPLIGVGLGNVHGVYQHHEIHSSYLGILAYSGLIGLMCYLLFMYVLIKNAYVTVSIRLRNKYHRMLYSLFPMLLGLLVSWAYTYHIRKREFWILVFFIVLMRFLSNKFKNNLNDN